MKSTNITNNSDPKEICNYLGRAFESMDIKLIDEGLEIVKSIDVEAFPEDVKCMFYYNIANGWNYKERLMSSQPSFYSECISKQIYYIRLSMQYSESTTNSHKSQIWTNLGNLYSHLGRLSEAINAWKQALTYTPDFGMAIGNMGQCIYKYGSYIFEEKISRVFLHTSYQLLKKASISKTAQNNAKIEYRNILKGIESVNNPKIFSKDIKYYDILKDKPKEQAQYWKWCIANKLALNNVNDIISYNAAAYDTIGMPSITLEGNVYPSNIVGFYLSMFNEIKQQYVSARYFVYKGTLRDSTHFSDENNLLALKTDYSNYSYNLELMKSGFKQCYSILDKIAYLLAEYLGLNISKNKIYFSSIWYDKHKNILPVFTDGNNQFLKALFWLSKDLKTKEVLNPEAQALDTLRNAMEHKSLNIIDYCESIHDDDLTLTIGRYDFERKTINLLSLVRCAVIYLLHGIYVHESKKPKSEGLIIPMEYLGLDDDWKR